jgi:hypothetical protein
MVGVNSLIDTFRKHIGWKETQDVMVLSQRSRETNQLLQLAQFFRKEMYL